MNIFIDQRLKALASLLPHPIYLVGGYVRNYLIDGSVSKDLDLAGALSTEEIKQGLAIARLKVFAEYKHTGTLVFGEKGLWCEYTAFRKDVYEKGGKHTPERTILTDSIIEDALRRDFKCNAVYYDIKKGEIVDPLKGVEDIKNKVLDTVKAPCEVFAHDGLRLMRLARFCAQLNFTPTQRVLDSATQNADNILDVSAERIYAELNQMLISDKKYKFSDKIGHYTSLSVLSKTRVLDRIIPELTLGRGMAQREDFHFYDVLEHSLKAVLYAPEEVRLYALLHDVGKPYCMVKYGKYHGHDAEGEKIVSQVLKRLKAPNKIISTAKRLTRAHMLDVKEDMREVKIRRFIVKNIDILPLLLALKQADFTACKDELIPCPTLLRWQEIYKKMLSDGTPFTLKDLKIKATDLMEKGYSGAEIGKTLDRLFSECVDNPYLNDRDRLLKAIEKG